MILKHRDLTIAQQIYDLQQASYRVEQAIIKYPDFPPLKVTVAEIQQEEETFLGEWVADRLAGVLSFTTVKSFVEPILLDIGRLIVHPDFFRRGIASRLLQEVENFAQSGMQLTVSTAQKNIPAVQLYQKHGYQIAKQTTLPDGLLLVRLNKVLTKCEL